MGKKAKNVFISHYNKDDESIQNLRDLLSKKSYSLKNSSIEGSRRGRKISDETIKRLLRMRVNWAGTVICLIGPKTSTRKWVNWELEQAHKKNKRIIGVFIRGAKEDSKIPENLRRYGHGLTGMNSEKIIDALNGKEIGWCDYNGETRVSSDRLIRISCQ